MHLFFAVVCCLTSLCLVPPALDWRSPLLSGVRQFAFMVLTIVPLCSIVIQVFVLRNCRRHRRAVRAVASLGIFAAAVVVTAASALEWNFHRIRTAVLHSYPCKLEKLGKHLIVGYKDPAEAMKLVRLRAVAGLFVSSHNVRGKSITEIKQEIRSFQSLRQQQGLPPLWIATDQEGGIVSRLSPPLVRQPSLSDIVERHSDVSEREKAVRLYARGQGQGLADLGINLNFAPVVDVNYQLVNPRDLFTRIHQRAISRDPAVVAQVAEWYCAALEETGVRCTLKHFPGLGRVYEDTHTDEATLKAALADLNDTDWVPFHALMKGSEAFTMLGHVRLKSMDAETPASFSPAIVSDLIRGYWKYDGVLITDNFTMQAVYRSAFGIDEASIRALNAGVDLILISYDTDQYYRVMYALLRAELDARLETRSLERSGNRLALAMWAIQSSREKRLPENATQCRQLSQDHVRRSGARARPGKLLPGKGKP